jgi:uncharacterized membrane protein
MKRRRHSVLPESVTHNLVDIINEQKKDNAKRSLHERIAETMTNFASTGTFFVFHIVWFTVWIVWNLGYGGKPFDPFPFELLTMTVSLEAIVLSVFVLIAQNRLQESADRRAELDLHVNLLAERESTVLLRKLCRIEHQLNIEVEKDEKELVNELLEDTNPVEIYKAIEQMYERGKKA